MLERRTSRNLKLIIRIAIVSGIAVIALNANPGQTEPASKDAASKRHIRALQRLREILM